MSGTRYRNRRVVQIENEDLLLSVTEEGGHVARILDKRTGVNPLWTPHWPSIEPSEFSFKTHPEFGESNEAKLVAGLLGHNICLDLFGAPSASEAAAGIPVHGEAPVAKYDVAVDGSSITMRAAMPIAEMEFERNITLHPNGVVRFRETVRNLGHTDRPIGWTQHVTLGAPFLKPGETRFLVTCDRSRVIDANFNGGLGAQAADADFDWPLCPMSDGSVRDLRVITEAPSSAGFTAHRMSPDVPCASFTAWSPETELAFGYAWRQADFPWLSRWEENQFRTWAPWNGQGYALGMEFGVSPFVKDRRAMVELGTLFETPTCLWLGARSQKTVEYVAFLRHVPRLPTTVEWNHDTNVTLRPTDDVSLVPGQGAELHA